MAACGALGEAEWLPVCRVVCPRCTAAKAPKADVVHTAGARPVILQAVKTILGKPPWDAVRTGGDVVRGKSAGHCVFTSAHRQGRTLPACGALEKVRTSPVRLGTACISQADKTALGCRLYRRDMVPRQIRWSLRSVRAHGRSTATKAPKTDIACAAGHNLHFAGR